jgi:hypothetical protein
MAVKIENGAGAGTVAKQNNNIYQRNAVGIIQANFEGQCGDLKGFIFDCDDGRQADRYNIAMKENTPVGCTPQNISSSG